MYPKLVEHKIKSIVNTNLRYCHNMKMKYYNFIIYRTMKSGKKRVLITGK